MMVAASVLLSVRDGTAAEEIEVDGIAVDANVADGTRAVRLVVSPGRAIRDWIRCGSGLRRVVRGRVRLMMRLWI